MMSRKNNINYYFNEDTKRYNKKGTSSHKKYLKEHDNKSTVSELSYDNNEDNEDEDDLSLRDAEDLRNELIEQSVDMVKKNQSKFKNIEKMSQKELDRALKKMLMKKLKLNKKKKKKKKKLITPPSSESESESDSDSETNSD